MSLEPPPARTPWYEKVEHAGERFLFASRWLLAPMYIGLVVALVAIAIKFFQELWHLATHLIVWTGDDIVLSVLALLDLGLLANLVLIVIFAGYENFVSKIAAARKSEDRPHWMGHVDFSGLKMKLIGSIVAISAIGLLADFTGLSKENHIETNELMWRVVLHLTFVVSGLLFAAMDWIGERRMLLTKQTHGHADESE
ncbi:TIGR00645 family protein [Rathayibacter sp. CAU 1779]